MPKRGPYKKYLLPGSIDEIPRTTVYRRKKMKKETEKEVFMDSIEMTCTSTHKSVTQVSNFKCTVNENINVDFVPYKSYDDNDRVIINSNNEFSDNSSSDKASDNEKRVVVHMNEEPFNEMSDNDIPNEEASDREYYTHGMRAIDVLNTTFTSDESEAPDNTHTDIDIHDNLDITDQTLYDSLNNQDKYLKECLCPSTKTTRREALLISLTFGLRHSLSWLGIVDYLQSINKLFGKSVVPDTKYLVQKYLPSDTLLKTYHVYCSNCTRYMGEKVSLPAIVECQCGQRIVRQKTSACFVEYNIKNQLIKLFENPKITKYLQYERTQKKYNKDAIEDVYHGLYYKKNRFLNSQWNFSYTFNTDGCSFADSSKICIWPLFIMINELPPHIRSQYIVPVGLWIDKQQPNMNIFGSFFVHQANELSNNGFHWQYNGKTIHSKVFPLLCSVDSPARCKLLNMKQFNGYFGCTYCLNKGVFVDGSIKFVMSSKDIPSLRTAKSIKEAMSKTRVEDDDLNDGIKGPSFLMNLKYFDLAKSLPPDYIHSMLLGVTRQFMDMILTSTDEEYYVGNPEKLQTVNKRLLSIAPPSIITRTPRSLDERKLWKASEWRSWLLFYSLPCLKGILSQEYLHHWSFFVTSMHILLQKSITLQSLSEAKSLLLQFLVKVQTFYGDKQMTYNMHLILYICEGVENFGPLWAQNTFVFKNANRLLLKHKHGPTRITQQLTERLSLVKNLEMFSEKTDISYDIKEFCNSMFQNNVKIVQIVDEKYALLGSGEVKPLTIKEIHLLNMKYNIENVEVCRSFQKIICGGVRYTTKAYQEKFCEKNNDSIIQLTDGKKGCIMEIYLLFVDDQEKIFLFMKTFKVRNTTIASDPVHIQHIKECDGFHVNRSVYKPDKLIRSCIYYKIEKKEYICVIPYGCLND